MKNKIFTFILVLSLLLAVLFTGCGRYENASNRKPSGGGGGGGYDIDGDDGNGGSGGNGGNGGSGGGGGGGTVTPGGDSEPFTVTLMLDGIPYTKTDGIQARWQNRYGIYSADFVNGVAEIKGLDGEYHVSLSALPAGDFTYDKNGIFASNKNRNVTIELLQVLTAKAGQMGWYEITKLGTYRAQVKAKPTTPKVGDNMVNSSSFVAYYFYPDSPGWYTITSWVDTEENKINPILYRYNGNPFSGFSNFDTAINNGGTEATYTKNFKLEYKIYDAEVGNAQLFAVGAESSQGYPVNVEFTVKYEGEYYNPYVGDPVYAEGPFYTGAKPSGAFRYTYYDTGNVLDGSRVKLNPDDKYYHLYDEVVYADNGGWGPLLFAKLTKDTEVFKTFTIGPPMTYVDMGFNFNHFNDGLVSCVIDGKDYAYMITAHSEGVFDENGNPVIDKTTNLPVMKHYDGYSAHCNSDGAHPVTEEIKTFLQGYASREFFFNDGNGMAEDIEQNGLIALNSNEDDQWLFACGYYK